ncbi:glycosyltransferase family 4 protein [Propionivibrio sp.]|uniref:glycosyltransferase family 4 protein n=1 Tax=Propionivibrio sp. TaxID=2212460 RepID=UPI003BF37F44
MDHVTPGKILLYIPWKFDMIGGVDVVVDRLWHGLEKRFPGISAIGIQDCLSHGDRIDEQGRQFLHLNLPPPPSAKGRLPLRYRVTLARRLPALLYDLHKRSITIVNLHFPSLNAYPLALLKGAGLWRGRIVLSFHGSDVGEILPASPCWRTIAEQTDAITACSADLARRIDELGLFRQPAQVVHNGIDCERFLKEVDETVLPVVKPYILNVGIYVPRKAQDVLLQAFAIVAHSYPELKIVCVGGTAYNDTWLGHLKGLAGNLNLQERVIFLENQHQNQVATLMRNAVCLAHTAHSEPFGLVLIEAGACGAPIIATRVGGIPEIIPSAEFGLLFDDGDVDQLVRAIDNVMSLSDESEKRAKKFHERILGGFSAEAMVSNYLRVLTG